MFFLAQRYLSYLLRASSYRGVHSPFVYDFCRQVLYPPSDAVCKKIEAIRIGWTHSKEEVSFEDMGAGRGNKGETGVVTRKIKDIAKRSARRLPQGRLLYHLCKYYRPKNGLELGTNLGISTLYQMAGIPPEGRFITIEGSVALAAIAAQNFDQMGVRPHQEIGEFSAVLARINLPDYRPDYVFIDGNHRYAPTIEYFLQILPTMPEGGILVFDDIHWSAEMEQAWTEICAHPQVTVSIDVFWFGIAFIRPQQQKEHFILR